MNSPIPLHNVMWGKMVLPIMTFAHSCSYNTIMLNNNLGSKHNAVGLYSKDDQSTESNISSALKNRCHVILHNTKLLLL